MTGHHLNGVGAARLLDERTLSRWIDDAQPGARLVYLSGMTAAPLPEALRERLHTEAARGILYLVQQRRRGADEPGFDYLAIRSSRPARATGIAREPSLHEEAEAMFARSGR